MIYQPSFQVVTLHLTFSSTGCEPAETQTLIFQQNQLEDVRTNITVWLTSQAIQVNQLKKLNHVLDEEYQITHILANVAREYSSAVEQVEIDRRTDSLLITMDENKKILRSNTYRSREFMVGLKMKWS